MKLPGRDLVPERLADLRDPERRLAPRDLGDVLEVDEDPLRRLGAEVDVDAGLLERADARLEHEVEVARLGQVAVGRLAGPLRRPLAAADLLVLGIGEVVGAEALLAGPAVDQRVAEAADVAGGLPDVRVEDDRGVERDDVVPLPHHRLEPARLDVVLQQDAVVAVVVGAAEAAVDLGRGEDEPAPLRQTDDLVHRDGVGAHESAEATGMTPAVVAAERAGIPFTLHEYEHEAGAAYGLEAAAKTGVDPARVFKTLVVTPGRRRSRSRSSRSPPSSTCVRSGSGPHSPTARPRSARPATCSAGSARSASGSGCRRCSTSRRSRSRRSSSARAGAASRSSSRRTTSSGSPMPAWRL